MSVTPLRRFMRSVRARIDGSRNLQRILENTSWLVADKLFRMGIGLVIWVWIARYLGPEQFGFYSYALAFVGLVGAVSGLGLDRIVVRDLVREPASRQELLGTTFLLRLIGGAAAMLIAVCLIVFLRTDDASAWLLVAVIAASLLFQPFGAIELWFESQVLSKFSVIARNAAFSLAAIVKVALILGGASLIAFAWAGLGESALVALGLYLAYRFNGARMMDWTASIRRARTLLKESWPLILSGLAIMIYMRVDQIMIGEILGDAAVGSYTAATRVSEIWYFIPVVIMSSLTPSIIEARKKGEEHYYKRMAQVFRVMSMIAIGIAVPMTFLSHSVITFLFGNEYAQAGSVLMIHIWAAIFVFLGVAQTPWTVNEGLAMLSLRRTMAGAIANVLLNLILIPRYQLLGAAVATVISYALSAFLANVLDRRTRRIFWLQALSLAPWKSASRAI